MDIRTYNGVVFDMDGLLLDTERLSFRAYQKAALEFGVDFPEALYLEMIGLRSDAAQSVLRSGLGNQAPGREIIHNARRHYYNLIVDEGISLKPGVLGLLRFLEAHGLPVAVATSTHQELAQHKLQRVGLGGRFRFVVSGHEVAQGKPAPDIFLEAAGRLGFAPESLLAIEDSESGFRAAHGANMPVVVVPDMKPATAEMEAGAVAVYASLEELLAEFNKAT